MPDAVTPVVTPIVATTPAVTATPTPAATAEVDISAADLQRFAKLSRENREAKARVKEMEAKLAEGEGYKTAADKLKAFETAKGEGKRLAALAALGMDSADDIDALISEAIKDDNVVSDPAVAAMKAELEAIKKRQVDDDKAAEDAKKKAAEDARAAGMVQFEKHISEFITKDVAKYPRCAREPESTRAIIGDLAETKRKLGRNVNDEEANKLIELAIAGREAYYAEKGKLYTVEAPPSRIVPQRRGVKEVPFGDTAQSVTPVTIDNRRGSTRSAPEPVVQMTAKEAKKLILNKLRQRHVSA